MFKDRLIIKKMIGGEFMSIFTKKEMDINAAKNFWEWFSANEEWIKAI